MKRRTSHNKNAWQYKVVKGQKMKPVLFDGRNQGQGKFFAAQDGDTGELVYRGGRPVPYKDV